MNTTDPTAAHDPLARKLPEEPHIIFLARDFRSPFISRMYADIREGKWAHAHEILTALERLARQKPPAPHKDKEHAWSARAVADQMDFWHHEKMRGEQTGNRVNTTAERDGGPDQERTDFSDIQPDDAGALGSQAWLDKIKTASPPKYPEEAT